MEIELRCPACRARQTIAWVSTDTVTCRRCEADLRLVSAAVAKIKHLRQRLSAQATGLSFSENGAAVLGSEAANEIASQLKLWDPAGRVE